MAHVMQEDSTRLPRKAASAIAAGVAVRSSASAANEVLPVATNNVRILGVSIATAASPGNAVAVQVDKVAKLRACASIGPGALVMVGSTNGRLAPVGAAASAPIPQGVQVVGESQQAAADGDYFSVLLQPVVGAV